MKIHPDISFMPLETLGFDHMVLLGRQAAGAAESAVRSHFHPGIFELHLVVRGKLSYRIDGRCHTMCAGDLLLIPPGMPHGTDVEPLGLCERYWLQIREPQSGVILPRLSVKDSEELVRRLRRAPVRPFRGGDAAIALFERLRSTYREDGDALRVVKLDNGLLGVILNFLELVANDTPDKGTGVIEKAIRRIEASRCSLPIAELARAAGMSESAFKTRFTKEIGLPPAKYVVRHRVELARNLLCATTRTVTEIAHELGFASGQHFATVFRRYIGVTPNAFRDGDTGTRKTAPVAGSGAGFATLLPLHAKKRPRRPVENKSVAGRHGGKRAGRG